MGKQRLKPGQHGAIFVELTGLNRWRGRTRLRLFDGGAVWVARAADSKDAARLRVQDGVTERLGMPRGSITLGSSSTVGEACEQWIGELRVRQAWPNAPVRPQTVDEYERNLGRHVVPALGRLRLEELTPAVVQGWIDGMIEGAKDGPYDMVTTTAAARGALVKVLDRAVVHDALRDNPARKTRAPVKKLLEPKAMTALDVGRLRAVVRSWEASRVARPGPAPTGHLPVVVDVMLGTGMRIGEVMALRWGEVDLSLDGRSTIAVGAIDTTGLTAIGARMYDPELGKFISVDPVMDLADPQQWAPYSYSNNNPTTWTDPTGKRYEECGTTHNCTYNTSGNVTSAKKYKKPKQPTINDIGSRLRSSASQFNMSYYLATPYFRPTPRTYEFVAPTPKTATRLILNFYSGEEPRSNHYGQSSAITQEYRKSLHYAVSKNTVLDPAIKSGAYRLGKPISSYHSIMQNGPVGAVTQLQTDLYSFATGNAQITTLLGSHNLDMTPVEEYGDGSVQVDFNVTETTKAGSAFRFGYGEWYASNIEPIFNSMAGSSGPASPMTTEISWSERYYPSK